MDRRYVAFDVETPNNQNDRMSAIGISVVEDGEIVREFYSLVDPEARFDDFNMALTGITPELVEGEPTFGELWPEIGPILDSGLLVAHNAHFDMSVLAKCLRDYGIRWRTRTRYACTCQMGKVLMPELPNHKLDTMCDWLDIELDHHNAGSDSSACAQLLCRYLHMGADVCRYARDYDVLRARTIRNPRPVLR